MSGVSVSSTGVATSSVKHVPNLYSSRSVNKQLYVHPAVHLLGERERDRKSGERETERQRETERDRERQRETERDRE